MVEDDEHFCVGCPGLKEKEKVHTEHMKQMNACRYAQ